jgi:hypothetical protein
MSLVESTVDQSAVAAQPVELPAAPRDEFTILRMLLLTAGVAVGLRTFWDGEFDPRVWEDYRIVAAAVLNGLGLPGPLITLRRRGQRPLDLGGLLWVTIGLGAWLLLPPSLVKPDGMAVSCLHYVVSLVCIWYLLAAVIGGRLRWSTLRATTEWSERFGIYLAMAWVPLGIWILCELYADAF